MYDTAAAVPGETAIFAGPAAKAKGLGRFSLTGERHEEHPNKTPTTTLIHDERPGQIVQKYRRSCPGCPSGWCPGNCTCRAKAPKGLKVSLIICDGSNYPEIWRDCAMKGAELIVRCQGWHARPGPAGADGQGRGLGNNSYVAVVTPTSWDGVYQLLRPQRAHRLRRPR